MLSLLTRNCFQLPMQFDVLEFNNLSFSFLEKNGHDGSVGLPSVKILLTSEDELCMM